MNRKIIALDGQFQLGSSSQSLLFINSFQSDYPGSQPKKKYPRWTTPSPFWSDLCEVGTLSGPSQMGLFSELPLELRLMIYHEMFCLPHAGYGSNIRKLKQFKGYLGILGSCRAIYWEARLIPFQRNVFNFCGAHTHHYFLMPNTKLADACFALKFVRSLRPWQAEALAGVMTYLPSDWKVSTVSSEKTHEILMREHLIRPEDWITASIREQSMLTRIVRTLGPIDAYKAGGEKVATVFVGKKAWEDLGPLRGAEVWFLRKPNMAKEIASKQARPSRNPPDSVSSRGVYPPRVGSSESETRYPWSLLATLACFILIVVLHIYTILCPGKIF